MGQFRDLLEGKRKLVWKKLGDQYTVSYSDDSKQVLGMFMKQAKGFDNQKPSYEVEAIEGIKFKKFEKIGDAKKYIVTHIESSMNEARGEKVYFEGTTLWVAYGEGSGMTSYNLDIKKYLNDDRSDKEHYDDIVSRIVRFSKENKPLKSKSNTKMFEVPVYAESRFKNYGQSLDVWGGDIKPVKKYYMIITEEKSTIVNFFTKKGEALAWIKSIA